MRTTFIFGLILFCISCSCDKDTECISCEFEKGSFEANFSDSINGIFRYTAPNIIIVDAFNYNTFTFSIGYIDTIIWEPVYLTPETLSIEITDYDGNLIYESDQIIEDIDTKGYDLWDGSYQGGIYSGRFKYHLQVEYEESQSLNVEGFALATTCEILNNCADPDIECDLTNCRYYPINVYGLRTCE